MSADNFKCRQKTLKSETDFFSKLENEPDLTLQKLDEDCQRIVNVRKDPKNIEESGVAYVRNVKHRSQSNSPVKERKYMITQNFNTGRLVTTPPPKKNNNKTKHPDLATVVEKYIGARTVPIVQKNVKTSINSDIRAHSVETEK